MPRVLDFGGPGSIRVLTALEHEPIPVTADGVGWSLTPAEADRLAKIGELRPGFCEVGHRQVKLAQFCGVVSLGDRVLEVLPKVDEARSAADACRGVLLRLLRRAERFPYFDDEAVGQQLRTGSLLEVFISAFFDSVTTLARGGLLRQYEVRSDELQVVRGKIELARQFGAHASRPDRLTCSFDELSTDNVWNRTLKKAIRCTRPWIRSVNLNRRWIELMGVLDGVDDGLLTARQIERLTFNRQAERYRRAIEWARWILQLLAPSIRAGDNQAPALLFDMNKLFESAVASVARGHVATRVGMSLQTQDRSASLATWVSPDRVEQAFQLRPDLVFRRDGEVIAIADTKWKLIARDGRQRAMPSEADMYQMHAYASAYGCHELLLIYPWRIDRSPAAEGAIHLPPLSGRAPMVRLGFIDVCDERLPLVGGDWPA